jgi:CRISPR-associated protein Cmr2
MNHLLLISIGPVQDFIAQARRTRDLWFGSHLLSELSRAGAAAIAQGGAKLIFPAMDATDPELAPCDLPDRTESQPPKPPVSVANKLLAVAVDAETARTLAVAARKAVEARWLGIAQKVWSKRADSLLARDRDGKVAVQAVWDEQVRDVLEFYAVWVPLGDNYSEARRRAEQALAGRKNLKPFRPLLKDRVGAPKSSLDGARVSVLPDNDKRQGGDFARFRVGDSEQLDAIGLIKRTGFEPEQFVPIVNVAAGEWLARAATSNAAMRHLHALRDACRQAGIPRVVRALPVVQHFGFDASVLYPQRLPALFRELKLPGDPAQWGRNHVEPLLGVMREPPSYVVCLRADGDHMGVAIDALTDVEPNIRFSRALADFPAAARAIVEAHLGSLVYAGGDDVLAFVPVANAVACAAKLRDAFEAAMAPVAPAGKVPTLSVGLGIAHNIEPMSSLLALAHDAEVLAKGTNRNALGVIVDKRSGGRRAFRLGWAPATGKADDAPLQRLQRDSEFLEARRLSTGKLYALETLRRRLSGGKDIAARPLAAAALRAYAEDALAHVGDSTPNPIALVDMIGAPPDEFDRLVDALATATDRIIAVRTMRQEGWQ